MVTTLQGVDLNFDCMMGVFANLDAASEFCFRDALYSFPNSGLLQEFKAIYEEYCEHRFTSTSYLKLKNVAETGIVDQYVICLYELYPNKTFVLEHFQHKPPKKLEILLPISYIHLMDKVNVFLPFTCAFSGPIRQINLMDVVKDFHALTHVTITSGILLDDDIKPLPLLDNLKFLDLSQNILLSGKYISECRKVVALYIESCQGIDSFHMSQIAEALRLERLSIMGCTLLTKERNSHRMNEIFLNLDCLYELNVDARIDKCIFPFIGGLMPKLKKLRINTYQINLNELLSALANNRNIEKICIAGTEKDESSSMDWSTISKIPRFRKLYIVPGRSKPFRNEVLNPMPHLEEFYLEACDNFSHTSLVTLYNACPNLNTWCVTDFRHVNTIFHIIKARRQETRARDIPLTFFINNEIDFEAIINDKRYTSAAAAGLVDARLTRDFPTPDWTIISPNVIE